MTSESLVVGNIVDDRIEELIKMFKDKPIHKIREEFSARYKITLTTKTLQQIYEVWEPMKNHACWAIRSKLRETSWWKDVERCIRIQTTKDVAEFIYENWKRYENRNS